MIETFQGWGALFYPKKYIKKLAEICKKNDILITFDEMQSGFSRTGKNFGFQHYGITPDLICCGKGMGGGVPLSGVIGKADLLDLPEIGNMSSTNSANPISCSAGLAVIEEIQKERRYMIAFFSEDRTREPDGLKNRVRRKRYCERLAVVRCSQDRLKSKKMC